MAKINEPKATTFSPVPNMATTDVPPDPAKIVDDINKGKLEPEKKPRKPYTKRIAAETSPAVDPKYYSAEIWGEVINLPFKVMEIATQYPNWQIDKEQKEKMGCHLGTVIKGFFPNAIEEKYLALAALLTLFLGTFGIKAAEWKIVSDNQKKAQKTNA